MVYHQLPRLCDNILRSIIKLSQNSIIFSVADALSLQWMHFVFERGLIEKVAFVHANYLNLLMFVFYSHYRLSTVFLSRRVSRYNSHRALEIPLIPTSLTLHPPTHWVQF